MSGKGKRGVVGFDLGGTKMMAVVYDRKWRDCGRNRRKTNAEIGMKAGLDRIAETIDKALDDAGMAPDQLDAIGIGVPGPLDPERGVVYDLPNMGWKDVPVKAALEKRFGCPVAVLNDVDAGTYGEYCFGAGQGKRCVLGVFPGTGIGGGCVYDGAVLRGQAITAMEVGHVCVLPEGALCGCGAHGCLETVASRLAIAQAVVAAAFRGEAPHLLSEVGTDLSKVRSGTLARAIAAGDEVVESIVVTAAGWLGHGIASVVNLLAPDVVVLGGGLVEAMPTLYLEAVETRLRERVMPALRDHFEVKVAELGDDAATCGAAAWAAAVAKEVAAG